MKSKKIIILLICVIFIVTGIVLVISSLLSDNNLNNGLNNDTEKTLLQIIKEDPGVQLEVSAEEIQDYNKTMADSVAFKYLLKIGKVGTTAIDGNEFTDEQKLAFASSYAFGEEYEELQKNAKTLNEEQPSYIKFEYLNNISKEFFGKEINPENLEYNFDGEYIEVSLPTSAPQDLYKFKEIKYNEQSDVYSIYFDEIDPEIYNYEEVANIEKIEYNSDAVLNTYRILYKKVNNQNIVLGIHQIL